ncbi:KR domain-containing protein [Hypoxylon sp. FL1857]|nr:KR domain-containing protein [Hypoxylon sp. FL1857]
MTAYHKILIHSAAGSTGQMAVAIAQRLLGAEVFATVGFNDKKQLLMDRFGIPDDHIFYSRDTSFAHGISRMMDGRGVDVALNSLSGDGLRASWECMAAYGRFVEIGKADIGSNAVLPMGGFARNVSFAGVDLLHISLSNPELTRSLVSKVLELVESEKISVPGPLSVFPVGEVEGAFRHMQRGRNVGRTIVTIRDADIISNLIVPSRSGESSDEASKVVAELEKRGCRAVARRCDVSSAPDLSALLVECSPTLPPIRGCINAAMALQDAIFENMSHTQWSTTIRSKVDTSYNLHTLLPGKLAFFILLSSLAGIYGPVAQSNYAAGCTFQDALAHTRSSASHPSSVALDLGWMRTIGIVAERTDYRRHREQSRDMDPVEEDDLVALLEHFCNHNPVNQKQRSQVLVGAVIPAQFGARGAIVVDALKGKLSRALCVDVEKIDTRKGLSDYGVDSLMAVELRNGIRMDFGANVAVFEIMGGVPIAAIGQLVVGKVADK